MEKSLKKPLASTKTVGIILAGGKSTIKGQTKPLFPINGRSMLEHAINAHQDAGVENILIVVNPANRRAIEKNLNGSLGQSVDLTVQNERRGTADALNSALTHNWAKNTDFCLVSLSDMPFWQSNTLNGLIQAHALPKTKHPGTISAVWHTVCPKIFGHYGQIHFNDQMAPTRVEEYSTNQNRTPWRGGWVSPCLWALTINAIADNLANCPKFVNRDRAALPSESYLSSLVAAAHEANKPFQTYFIQNHAEEAIGINNWHDWQHYARYHAQAHAL